MLNKLLNLYKKSVLVKIGILLACQIMVILVCFNVLDSIKTSSLEDVVDHYSEYLKDVIFMSTYDYLKKGNMAGFQEILNESATYDEVNEFSLLASDGIVRYSSNPDQVGSQEDIDISMQEEFLVSEGEENIYYFPVKTTSYCTRCHMDWKENSINSFYKITLDNSRIASIKSANLNYQVILTLFLLALIVLLVLIIKKMFLSPIMLINESARRLALGDINLRGVDIEEAQKLNTRQDELGEVGRSFNELIKSQRGKSLVAKEIADGNLEVEIQSSSEYDILGQSMHQMVAALNEMKADAIMLSQSALEGRLEARANASKHKGDYAAIIDGVNKTLDAVIRPLQEAALVLGAAADKDLTLRVEGSYKGQLAELRENINTTVSALDDALKQVAQMVDQVNSAGKQISSGSLSLAEGANDQASSLEEVSATLEKVSSMTANNAKKAGQANKLSTGARKSAVNGNDAMKQVSVAINEMKQTADKSSEIVGTINDIAFQTNMLALNAAIEAARAGESGKGFAVVAQEVRNLAQRSREAATNTAHLIEESMQSADSSVETTQRVGKILEELADDSNKVNVLVDEIALEADEQAKGIEQANEAMAQIEKIAQMNAANSEQTTSSSKELTGQAGYLLEMVSKFKLTDSIDTRPCEPDSVTERQLSELKN